MIGIHFGKRLRPLCVAMQTGDPLRLRLLPYPCPHTLGTMVGCLTHAYGYATITPFDTLRWIVYAWRCRCIPYHHVPCNMCLMRIVHYRTQGTRTWFALVRLALVVTAGLSGFITVCALIAMVGCFWATLVSAIRAYDHRCCRVWNTVNQFILLAGITTTSRFG